ncbi:MAG: restriction endonuclease subunit S [Paludibacteraceae bacterium]|nr:restriction endonuclease subunit S [Paludibacteraceae bacterium]
MKTSKSVDKNGLFLVDKDSNTVQFIGRTQVNNGIQGYTKRLHFAPNPAQTFSVIQIGDKVIQYRESEWYASQNIFILTPLFPKLIDTNIYIIGATNKALLRFNGGYNDYPTLNTLKKLRITLPTTSDGNIDFHTMETFVKELEQECLSQIFAKNERTLDCYLKAANAADTTLTNEEKKAIDQIENMRTTFSTIAAEKIFSVKGNPQLNKENFIFAENAEYPYFTRTVKNNGFLGYVKYLDEAHKIDGKVLAVGMLGMQFFYVDHDYYSGQFTKSIRPKDFELDEVLALWFISWFNQSSNYYKSLLVRDFEKAFNNTKITLPIDADGKIDFALMRMYISAIKKIVIQEVRERMAKEYAAYHQVIGETE